MPEPRNGEGCPCQSKLVFSACCGPIIQGDTPAETAEALMRSRYCAYVIGDLDYLLYSWHSRTRPVELAPGQDQWIKLKIIATEAGQPGDDQGMVEFVAVYKVNGRAERLQERSRFGRENGRWCYLYGEHC